MTEEEANQKLNLDKLDAAVELFPKECIYMRWNYGDATTPAHKKVVKWYGDKGLKVMGATAASAGDSPFIPRENTKAKYIKDFSQLVADNHLVGILATAWGDGSPHLETVWRGYIAQREYGFLPENNRLAFLDALEKAAFSFDEALVTSGHRNPAFGVKDFMLLELPDKANPDTSYPGSS